MDKANQTDNSDEISGIDSETGKRYVMNIKTGEVKEIKNESL